MEILEKLQGQSQPCTPQLLKRLRRLHSQKPASRMHALGSISRRVGAYHDGLHRIERRYLAKLMLESLLLGEGTPGDTTEAQATRTTLA